MVASSYDVPCTTTTIRMVLNKNTLVLQTSENRIALKMMGSLMSASGVRFRNGWWMNHHYQPSRANRLLFSNSKSVRQANRVGSRRGRDGGEREGSPRFNGTRTGCLVAPMAWLVARLVGCLNEKKIIAGPARRDRGEARREGGRELVIPLVVRARWPAWLPGPTRLATPILNVGKLVTFKGRNTLTQSLNRMRSLPTY